MRMLGSATSRRRVSIIDLGGNVRNVFNRLLAEEAEPEIASVARDLADAERIVIPGIGCFDPAMRHLRLSGLGDALHEAVKIKGRPVLGICLGMHLMFEGSEEGVTPGLGFLPGQVERLKVANYARYKVPHVGWNTIDPVQEGALLRGVAPDARYYFAHSYCLYSTPGGSTVATTSYEKDFVSMVERDNLFGTQFHPEKSHALGRPILRNFLRA